MPLSPALHIERKRRAISAGLQTQVWAEICRLCSGWDVDSERTDTFAAVGICQCMVWSGRAAGIVHDTSLLAIHQSAQSRKTGLTRTRSKTWKGCIFDGASALMGLSHQTAEPCCYWPVEWGLRLHGYTSQRTSPHLTESYKERKQNASLQNEVQQVFLLTVWNMVHDPNN